MASISVTNRRHTGVVIAVDGLQYSANEYDKIVFVIMQNGRVILKYPAVYSGSGTSITFTFENPDYLGNNWLSPGTNYAVQADCYYNTIAYTVGPVSFTTQAITPPSGSISPAVYPTVKSQGANGNCGAMSLSTAMEIFRARAGSYEKYSVSYIYGSDGREEETMNSYESVMLCEKYGSPRWELVTREYPDSNPKDVSRNIFNYAVPLARSNALAQRFTGHRNIDFYDCAAVANAIRTYGCFIMGLRVPYNLHSVPPSGIVPQPDGWGGAGHALTLIGLTTINGKAHWIAQNSWGESWGKNGLCYIPYDWGCGVQSPQDEWNTNQACGWTGDCYSVWNNSISTANPAAPANLAGRQDGNSTTATLSWSLPDAGSSVLLYARRRGTSKWWPKPDYGSLFSGTGGQILFDSDAASYEVFAIAVKGNLLSAQTSPITISISFLEPFSWSISNGSASAGQTQAARRAMDQEQPAENFSYKVWNDIVEKINEAALAAGFAWDPYYATLSGTRLSGGYLTAKQYNSARYNIGIHHSTGIDEAHSGDEFTWRHIDRLVTKLNEWIADR